nr:recombinase family protein [Bradyrhizobium cajani]
MRAAGLREAVNPARYSSENQRDASIEDQLRLCRLHAEKQGWTAVDSYTDRAISGVSLLRPGIQELISDAMRGKFAVVLAEAMDRSAAIRRTLPGYLSAWPSLAYGSSPFRRETSRISTSG